MRLTRRNSVIIVSLVIGLAVVAVWILRWQRLRDSRETQAQWAGLQEIAVRTGEITDSISALGNLEPYTRVEVRPEVAGRIESVFVKEGEFVRKGQALVKIDPKDLLAKLRQAEASYLSAQVKLNRLLAGTSAADLAQAEASYEQARVSLDDAKKQLSRDEVLFRAGAISEQQLQDSRTKVELSQQQFTAAKEKLESLRRAPDKEDVEVARAELAQAEANLNAIRDQVNSVTVKAPIDGTVTDVKVQANDIVNESTTLVVVADLSKMKAVIPVNEIDIPKIAPGQAVSITLDALPGQRFEGRVSSVGYEGQVRDNIVTYEVIASIPNSDGKLKGGMTADVTIILQSKKDVLIVPVGALQERRGETIVLVPGEDGPVPRSVKVGVRNDSVAEIVEGLSPGDRILARGAYQMPSSGSNVRSGFDASRMPFGSPFMMNMRTGPRR